MKIDMLYDMTNKLFAKEFDKIRLLCYNMFTLKKMWLRFTTESYILLFRGVEI